MAEIWRLLTCFTVATPEPAKVEMTQSVLKEAAKAAEEESEKPEAVPAGEPYVVDARIGSGTFGVVYRGFCGDEAVALKAVKLTDRRVESTIGALGELRALYRFRHANVLRLRDVFASETALWFVTDCYEESVASMVERAPVQTRAAAAIFLHVARALEYVHSLQYVHRDIKPANIFVRRGWAVLGDLGAMAHIDALVAEDNYIVTRWYRAPEIIEDRDYGTMADMWSLGCVLGEMVAGRALLKGTSTAHQRQLIEKMWKGTEAPTAQWLEERLEDEATREGVSRLLQRNPAMRTTAAQVVAAAGTAPKLPLMKVIDMWALRARARRAVHQLYAQL